MEGAKDNIIPPTAVVELVQKLYAYTTNTRTHWNDDEQFQAMNLSLCLAQSKLCRDRNANLSIMRIPPEVMAIIFRLVRDAFPLMEEDTEDPEGPLHFSYHWLALAHVCHHWRDIATSCATLWSTIDIVDRRCGKHEDLSVPRAFLAHSCAVPLSLQLLTTGHSCSSWHLVSSVLNHIRDLRVYGRIAEDELAQLADDAAPQLEQLVWHVVCGGISKTTTLPRSFLERCPRLTSLRLGGPVDFGSSTFQSLRQLHLCGQLLTGGHMIGLFYAFLAANAGIEDLCLTSMKMNLQNADLAAPVFSERALTLSRLRRLAFVETRVESIIPMLALLGIQGSERPLAFTCDALRVCEEELEHLGDLQRLVAFYPPPSIQYREATVFGNTMYGFFTIWLCDPTHSLCLMQYEYSDGQYGPLSSLLEGRTTHLEALTLLLPPRRTLPHEGPHPPADDTQFGETVLDILSIVPAVQVLRVLVAQESLRDLWVALETCCLDLREIHLQLTALPSDISDGLYELLVQTTMSRTLAKRKSAGREALQSLHLYAPPNTMHDPDLPRCEELVKSLHLDQIRDIQFHTEEMNTDANYPPICSTPAGLWDWPGCGPAQFPGACSEL